MGSISGSSSGLLKQSEPAYHEPGLSKLDRTSVSDDQPRTGGSVTQEYEDEQREPGETTQEHDETKEIGGEEGAESGEVCSGVSDLARSIASNASSTATGQNAGMSDYSADR